MGHRLTVVAGVLLLGLATFCTGLWRTPRMFVVGGSMAPALVGEHRDVTCGACGFRFACGSEFLPPEAEAVCPNCGARTPAAGFPLRPGDRLVLAPADRSSAASYERWSLVVLRNPERAAEWCVKRVVGLPGEAVEIRAGDVYVDGRIAPRSLEQLLEMAVVVYDTRFRPSPRSRLSAAPGTDSRDAGGASEELVPAAAKHPSLVDWVAPQVWQGTGTSHAGASEATPGPEPVFDDLAYNQSQSRVLWPVGDLILRCRLRVRGDRLLGILACKPAGAFAVSIDCRSGEGYLNVDGSGTFEVGPHAFAAQREVVLAVADHRARFVLDGRVLADQPFDWSKFQPQVIESPLGASWEKLELEVSDLVVLRDVYYLDSPQGRMPAMAGACQLGADEYWLLGDNSSVSVDSRTWGPVSGKALIGKVLAAPRR